MKNKIHVYFVFALVTTTERALHSVAALYSYLSPYNNTGGRLFGALHNKTTARHAESWSNLGQDLRKRLKNTEKCLRCQSFYVGVCALVHQGTDDKAEKNNYKTGIQYVQSSCLGK